MPQHLQGVQQPAPSSTHAEQGSVQQLHEQEQVGAASSSSVDRLSTPRCSAPQPAAVSAATAGQATSSSNSQQPTALCTFALLPELLPTTSTFSWCDEPSVAGAAQASALLSKGAAVSPRLFTAPKPTPVLSTIRKYLPPTTACLEAECPTAGVSILLHGRIVACPRTMLDSGANVNLMVLDLATLLEIGFTPEQAIALQGTTESPSSTRGRVQAEVDIGVGMGTEGQVVLRVPIHVVRVSKQQSWGLLLGTGFLNLIGASLDFFTSQLHYRPHLPDVADDEPVNPADSSHPANVVYSIPMITTTDKPSPAFLADLLAPTGSLTETKTGP